MNRIEFRKDLTARRGPLSSKGNSLPLILKIP